MVVVAAVVVVVVRSMVVRNPVAVLVLLVLPSQALQQHTLGHRDDRPAPAMQLQNAHYSFPSFVIHRCTGNLALPVDRTRLICHYVSLSHIAHRSSDIAPRVTM